MSTAKYAPRHRKVRPMAPISGSTTEMPSADTLVRGTAAVSVTGLALTAVIAPTVNAAPTHEAAHTEAASLNTTAVVGVAPNTVSVADIAWAANDVIEAAAEAAPEERPAPAAEAQSEVEEAEVEAANRSETREEPNYEHRVAAVNAAGGDIVSIASSLLGIPYVYGGSTPAGFDCSGFTQYVYAAAGISIPRTSGEQGYAGTFVSAAEARPGDLVWHAYGHVGIYAGNGMVIEATTPGSTTTIQPLWGNYQFVRY